MRQALDHLSLASILGDVVLSVPGLSPNHAPTKLLQGGLLSR